MSMAPDRLCGEAAGGQVQGPRKFSADSTTGSDLKLPETCLFSGRKEKNLAFKVNVMEPVSVDGEVVSSTLIRSLIKSGDVDECHKYLGRNYDIGGEVVVGNRLGKSLGFPTSNIMIDENMVTPPNGVYITYCIYNGKKYPSVTNVGVKPTVGIYKKNVETHIFNFNKELYGKYIKVGISQDDQRRS